MHRLTTAIITFTEITRTGCFYKYIILSKIMSPSSKTKSQKLKMLGPLCNQTVHLKTDSKTLFYSILKLKYGPSILKQNKGKKMCIVKQQP